MAATSTHHALLALGIIHAHVRASHALAFVLPTLHQVAEEDMADFASLTVRQSPLFDSNVVGTVETMSEGTKILIGSMLGIFIFGGIVCAIALYFYWDELVPCASRRRRIQAPASAPPEAAEVAADDASIRAVHKISPRTGRPRVPGRARTRADHLPEEIRRSGTQHHDDTLFQEPLLEHHAQMTAKIVAWRERARPIRSPA